jgi:hypothetical protein
MSPVDLRSAIKRSRKFISASVSLFHDVLYGTSCLTRGLKKPIVGLMPDHACWIALNTWMSCNLLDNSTHIWLWSPTLICLCWDTICSHCQCPFPARKDDVSNSGPGCIENTSGFHFFEQGYEQIDEASMMQEVDALTARLSFHEVPSREPPILSLKVAFAGARVH